MKIQCKYRKKLNCCAIRCIIKRIIVRRCMNDNRCDEFCGEEIEEGAKKDD
jgi:hypothetical protein